MVIIFPLREKIHRLFAQQRPRYTGGLRIAPLPIMPWNNMNRPQAIGFNRYNLPPLVANILPTNYGLCVLGIPSFKPSSFKPSSFKPSVIHALKPMPTETFEIIGVSKDASGVALGSCTMNLFRIDYDSGNNLIYTHQGKVISDASGNYTFNVNKGSSYRITADNSTGPVMGVTVNTLTGVLS
jgi:hypothetical protein